MDNVMLAAGLTLFAGLATSVGGATAIYIKRSNTRFLTVALGFSAGVMIYVSMIEIMGKAGEILTGSLGEKIGNWATVMGFFGGMLLIALIDKSVSLFEKEPEIRELEGASREKGDTYADAQRRKLLRMGLFTALAVAIHNFPEGFITFFSTLRDPVLGVSIAIAVAIHNIPEGIAVAVPIYYATGNRKIALFWAFLSGIVEPIGALMGYAVLASYLTDTVYGIIFASVAGIMVYISFDQLLPTAREYGEHRHSLLGLVGGMAIMAISLLFFL